MKWITDCTNIGFVPKNLYFCIRKCPFVPDTGRECTCFNLCYTTNSTYICLIYDLCPNK